MKQAAAFILGFLISASLALASSGKGITLPPTVVQDEATPLTYRSNINFTGAGVTCADNAGSNRTDCTIPGGAGAAYATVQDEATPLTQRSTINFTGAGITCTDNAGTSTTDCNVPASAPGSGITYAEAAAAALAGF